MEDTRVRYESDGTVATLTLDDGNKNVVSPGMIRDLNAALDRAETEGAVVILTGREDVFSAGFDLNVLRTGVVKAFGMIIGGFQLSLRLLSFPTPVVIACNGHAMAMGSFLVLSGDYRLGAEGPFKIVANEVAIGLTMPYSAIEICRQRLANAHFFRATMLSESYDPAGAVEAGYLDRVVPADELMTEAMALAEQLAELDLKAHRETKLRVRSQAIRALKTAIMKDRIDFVAKGVGRVFKK